MTRIGINGFGRMGRLALRAGKVLAWYDNEIGCVDRLIELAQKVGATR